MRTWNYCFAFMRCECILRGDYVAPKGCGLGVSLAHKEPLAVPAQHACVMPALLIDMRVSFVSDCQVIQSCRGWVEMEPSTLMSRQGRCYHLLHAL